MLVGVCPRRGRAGLWPSESLLAVLCALDRPLDFLALSGTILEGCRFLLIMFNLFNVARLHIFCFSFPNSENIFLVGFLLQGNYCVMVALVLLSDLNVDTSFLTMKIFEEVNLASVVFAICPNCRVTPSSSPVYNQS